MRTDLRRWSLLLVFGAHSCLLTKTPPPLEVDCAATPDSAERYPDLCAVDAGVDAEVDAGP